MPTGNNLNVSIGAEIAGLEKGLDKAESRLKGFEGKVKKLKDVGDSLQSVGKSLSKNITAPILAVGVAIGKTVSDVAKFGAAINDSASQAGLTAESYQELEFAMRQYGISATDSERTFGRLNQRIGLAIAGNEKYSKSFQNLAVSVKNIDGTTRGTEQVFLDVAESLSKIENPAQRSAAASELFGVNLSRRLLPALGEGADGIKNFMQEARDLGIVMSNESTAAAESFVIAVENLKDRFSAIYREIGMKFMPVIENQVLPIIESKVIPAFQKFSDFIENLIDAFNSLPSGLKKGIAIFTGLAAAIGPVSLALGTVIKLVPLLVSGLGGLGTAFTVLTGPIGLTVAAIVGIGVAVVKNWDKIKPYILDSINWFIDLYNQSTVFRAAIQYIGTMFKINFAIVSGVLKTAWEVIKTFVKGVADQFRGLGGIIKGAFTGNLSEIKGGIKTIMDSRLEMVKKFGTDLKEGFEDVSGNIGDAVLSGIENTLNPTKLKHVTDIGFSGLKDAVKEKVAKDVSQGVEEGFSQGLGRVPVQAIESNFSVSGNSDLSVLDKNAKGVQVGSEKLRLAVNKWDSEQTRLAVLTSEFNNAFNSIIESTVSDSISGAFQSIGQAIGEGGNAIEAFGLGLLQSFGNFLSEMGRLMIKYGVAGLAISTLTKALSNPITAGPAAIGLIAAGAALSVAGAAISSLARGGSGGGAAAPNVSQSGANYEAPQSQGRGQGMFSEGRVVFEISGRSLVGVLSRTVDRNNRLGGNLAF